MWKIDINFYKIVGSPLCIATYPLERTPCQQNKIEYFKLFLLDFLLQGCFTFYALYNCILYTVYDRKFKSFGNEPDSNLQNTHICQLTYKDCSHLEIDYTFHPMSVKYANMLC